MLCKDRRAYSAHAFGKNGVSEHCFETAEMVLRGSNQTGEQTGEIVRKDCAPGRAASLTKLYSRKYSGACRYATDITTEQLISAKQPTDCVTAG